MSSDTITLNAQCHCKRFSATYELPRSVFPLRSGICSCDSCRQTSGLLAALYARIPSVRPDVSSLTAYASSEQMTRYFCPMCGCHVCLFEEDGWAFATGVLDKTQGLLERTLMWIDDTKDGGISVWMSEIGGKKIKCLKQGRSSDELTEKGFKAFAEINVSSEDQEEKLEAKCHCGGVHFYIVRPGDATNGDAERLRWRRDFRTKYPGAIDVCNSCRLTSGFEFATWVYVHKTDLFWIDGKPLEVDMGTLRRYESSNGVYRDFCNTCGATIFFSKDERKIPIYDIGIGVVRSKHGSRAEEYFRWKTDGINFRDDSVDDELVDSLENGLVKWYKGKEQAKEWNYGA
ncbi:MAG: hypothetical protein M1834_009659 [Cirrosporium novae-zelandiae]|nr:MAG: hypothetical protein M1834_009659 [Cirrosporium novae-zelandiae]